MKNNEIDLSGLCTIIILSLILYWSHGIYQNTKDSRKILQRIEILMVERTKE